ncbi:MAG: glutamate synthase large subunit, partial [Chthoniobacterales bacterium]
MRAVSQSDRPGLCDPFADRAACGVGVLVQLDGTASHALIEDALDVLVNIDHRGARGAEEMTGDGAGVMIQIPHEFFAGEVDGLGNAGTYGVGMAYLPKDYWTADATKRVIEKVITKRGFRLIAWRAVPTDSTGLGRAAIDAEPRMKQFFVTPTESGVAPNVLDTRLYLLRRAIETAVVAAGLVGEGRGIFYICSLDRRTIVYKGLLTCEQVRTYFPDLSDPRMKTAIVLLHSRFSTNTLGAWQLAHPFRAAVHNGEINTLRGNLNRMRTREAALACEKFGDDIDLLKPVVGVGQSDTAAFDNVLELLMQAGRSLPHALRLLIPEAWSKDASMSERRRTFYDYLSTISEPWDGPALVAATDGTVVAAALDRNGLRPCRYVVTTSGRLIMASELGVLETPQEEVVLSGRLKPGQLFVADTSKGRVLDEEEVFAELAKPEYGEWLEAGRVRLSADPDFVSAPPTLQEVEALQAAFGYTVETLRVLVQPMAELGKDPIGAMGNDAPPAFLSARQKPLSSYFSQLFAQVSNPPLDFMREDLVTSLESHIGRQRNLLTETADHCRQLWLKTPFLMDDELNAIRSLDVNGIRSTEIDLCYDPAISLREAIERLRTEAAKLIRDGFEILILSDRGVSADRIAIPALLAVGALQHYLIEEGLRTRTALVVDTGEAATVHSCCTLIGFGADAIHPWLAHMSLAEMSEDGHIEGELSTLVGKYHKALEGGILKVMSKMGISTLESYKGAQVFQAIGLDFDFVEEFFHRTPAQLPAAGLPLFERELRERHEAAFGRRIAGNLALDQGGDYYWRRDGELHQWSPFAVARLQAAVRSGDSVAYSEFAQAVNAQDERLQTIRGMLEFDTSEPIPIDDVESVESIITHFATGSMSFGSLSRETHEALAVAMNRVGGKSGSGEGGEQVDRFGTERENSMKQIASGRFGVTTHYLVNARQLEIKMAQGAKPGEGGELPGAKVNDVIAEVRFTTPGVGLISPPPHHDIYSIEDLAQLIHDLKCANPDAEINVKLVSVANVGTIAAGVAKARADAVLIAGDSGGTGAAVKTSIKSTGAMWELGLAETQQVLLANNLRSRIRVRTDGGLRTGRDVAVAALLGAEEYGFGTAALVALGCVMLRKCHCNTCSVGIATQDPELRKKFAGEPEHVMAYMRFIAEEVRELMAAMGFRTMREMVGRVDKLRPKDIAHPKGLSVNLSQLLYRQPSEDTPYR